MSVGVGAKIDATSGVLGQVRDALGRLFGADPGHFKCHTVITVIIDTQGTASMDVKIICDKL